MGKESGVGLVWGIEFDLSNVLTGLDTDDVEVSVQPVGKLVYI